MTKENANGQYGTKSDQVSRSSKGRKNAKRRRDTLVVGGILVFVVLVAVLCLNVFLKVSEIRVENEAIRYTDDQIVAASGLKTDESLLGIKKNKVSENIEKTLPYIGKAHVVIRVPDTVVISVEYTQAKLCVSMTDGYVLLDENGKVLQTGVGMPADYIAEVTGAALTRAVPGEKAEFADADMFSYVTGLAKAFAENGITGVTAYDFTRTTDVIVEINYNTDIKLGSISKAVNNLQFGKEVIDRTLAQLRGSTSKMVIDLTEGDRAYVRSQEDIDAAAEAASNAARGESETVLSTETQPDVPSTIAESTAQTETSAPAEESSVPAEESSVPAAEPSEQAAEPASSEEFATSEGSLG